MISFCGRVMKLIDDDVIVIVGGEVPSEKVPCGEAL
jgi:hypothetical protein